METITPETDIKETRRIEDKYVAANSDVINAFMLQIG